MKRFPKVLPAVDPLYSHPHHVPLNYESTKNNTALRENVAAEHSLSRKNEAESESTNVGGSRLAKHKFNYRSTVKILQTKMYEPVSDGSVTIITPKYSISNAFDQSDAEDDAVSTIEPAKHPSNQSQQTLKMLNQQLDPTQMINHCDSNKIPSGMGDNCIDVEHLNFERNYRNKFKSVSVQTSQLAPYRLRFWPKGASSNLKCMDGGFLNIVKCCLKTLSQWFLSQIGLTLVLIIWALLGAAAFYKTEGPREKEQSEELEKLKRDVAVELATELRQTSGHEDKWPKTVDKYLKKYEVLLLEAVTAGYGEGGGGGNIWTYPGCILFAVALLTTLGFGAPVPRTSWARGAAMLFSAIGIPLHFLLILNIGNMAAGALQNLATVKQPSDIPDVPISKRQWIKWFPFLAIIFYYTLGVIFFGVLRKRTVVECLIFPLDFTAAGGVAKTSGYVRILYAIYLEIGVTLAAVVVSLLQASASRGIIDLGLRLGLLTNT